MHSELATHSEWLHRLARALVGEGGDDIAQDVMAVAIAQPPKQPGPLQPWLAGVTKNLARMSRRGRQRRERREQVFDAGLATSPPTPEELVERARAHQQVSRIVLELPEPWRSVVLLRYFEDVSAADIARLQGISAATVRGRLADGLERIRAALDREHAGERRRWIVLIAPLPSLPIVAASHGGTAALAGGLLVKTSVKVLVGLVVVAVLAMGARLAGLWGGDSKPVAVAANGSGSAAARPIPSMPPPIATIAVPGTRALDSIHDDDPPGTLRLEGQVIDEADQPVARAIIAIDANPPIVVESEDDGSFVFERLIARDYRIEATKGDRYAGPARLRMTSQPEPLTLRMRRGGTVEVKVTERPGGAPVRGAELELRSTLVWKATTNADGVATIRGIGPAWASLVARANGFAPSAVMVGTSDNPAAPVKVDIALARGAAISGRVIDDAGKPVAEARVVAASASDPFPVIDARRDGVVTAGDGSFTLPAISAGSWRLTAAHGDHAPASSPPIIVDGVVAKTGVQLVLSAGAIVRGVVKDPRGQPVANADVRVVVRGSVPWRARRQALSGADGTFVMTGLPRRAVDVVAWHEDAGSSAIAVVDLDVTRDAKLALVLDIGGAIAGTVVDRAGTPVSDAQVIAEPVWSGGVDDRAAWSVRGIQEAVTSQGGGFRFVGLPDGTYHLRAARPGASDSALALSPTTPARPGATHVRLVVPADAKLVGKVAFSDGKAPPLFAVSLGGTDPVPFASIDGTFTLTGPAGEHSLSVTGPSFTEARVAKVTLVEGKEADAGTITVTHGRSISGRVTDENGTPVAGAKVAGGKLLTGNGNELYIESESIGAKVTVTDAAGRFSLDGFGPTSLTVVAGKDGVGRSPSLHIARSEDSVTVDLVLQPTSGVDGKITKGGAPLADVVVIAKPFGSTASNFFTTTGPDGTFALDSLAPGSYIVTAMLGGGGPRPKDIYARRFEIVLGKRAHVELDATPGAVALDVSIKSDAGGVVPMAQVMAIGMHIEMSTVEQLREGAQIPESIGNDVVTTYVRQAFGGALTIEGMRPGKYTICAVPIVMPVDEAKLQTKCGHVTLVAAVPKARLAIVIPAAWLEKPAAGSAPP